MSVRHHLLLLAVGSFFASGPADTKSWAHERSVVELAPHILADVKPDLEIVFCALDMATGSIATLNGGEIDRRHTPWSTFKIPNLIIALELGIATDLHHRRVWDQRRRPAADDWPRAWKQDQTLATAFKRSAVWYFQDMALEVGTERYRSDLQRYGYGNASVPMNGDDFWLSA